MFKNFIYLFLVAFSLTNLSAQSKADQILQKIATPESTPQWLRLETSERMSREHFIQQLKEIFELKATDELQTFNIETDIHDHTHHRLQQTHKGVPVEDGVYLLHEKDGLIHTSNGYIVKGLDMEVTPTLSEIEALELLLNHIDADEYAWENEAMESFLQKQYEEKDTTHYPSGKLMIMTPDYEAENKNYHLTYQFDVYATQPHHYHSYYVDAHTGEVVDEYSHFCHADGSGDTGYYGIQDFNVSQDSTGFHLEDTVRNIGVYDAQNTTSPTKNRITSLSNNFMDESTQTACSVFWIASRAYDYFAEKHGRIGGHSKKNAPLSIYVNYGPDNIFTAEAAGSTIRIGGGNIPGKGSLASIDLIAHEYMHNLIGYDSNLRSRNEPGALNESFADIFGTVIEYYLTNTFNLVDTPFDWEFGEDILTTPNNALRSLSNPKSLNNPRSLGSPDTYQGDNWITDSEYDDGGIHINNGVQNYWFYLLSKGGVGENDNGYAYSVEGIGIEKAADIAYQTVHHYLTLNSRYIDARNASIDAAIKIFGSESNEVKQVLNAWCAVGVGTCTDSPEIIGKITLTAPNGGEQLNAGTEFDITWDKVGNTGNSVSLEYSNNGGLTWKNIITDAPNTGSYNWTLPDVSTNSAFIHINSNDNLNIVDISDEDFSIKSCNPVADFAVNTLSVCVDKPLTFTNLSTGDITGYEWFVNGELISKAEDFSHTFKQVGNNTVVLKAWQDDSCADFMEQNILIRPLPDPNFCYSITGLQVTFIPSTSSIYNQSTFIWDYGDEKRDTITHFINADALTSAVHTYSTEGTYNVCLTISNDCSIGESDCRTIAVSKFLCDRERDSLALVALYNATNGKKWTNSWNLSEPIDTWHGITLDDDKCTVRCLDLSGDYNCDGSFDFGVGAYKGNNLVGFLPPELGNLKNLNFLGLSKNQLEGPIPPELENLTNLVGLDLHSNNLSGLIPPELGNLTNLKYLNLLSNQLEGTIPPELGNLSNLVNLYIGGSNLLTGPIPPELGNLSNLLLLAIAFSEINGTIPPELGNLSKLRFLILYNNNLRGNIPLELTNLNDLGYLALNDNNLSGNIPPELGNLKKLEQLNLSNNNLSKNIPSELGNLINLSVFSLANNDLSGNIPPELGKLTNLCALSLSDNNLRGSIPSELGNLSSLRNLYLGNNKLKGCYSDNLCKLNLINLHIENYQLNDCYSDNSCDPNLIDWYMYIGNNQLNCYPPGISDIIDLISDLGDINLIIDILNLIIDNIDLTTDNINLIIDNIDLIIDNIDLIRALGDIDLICNLVNIDLICDLDNIDLIIDNIDLIADNIDLIIDNIDLITNENNINIIRALDNFNIVSDTTETFINNPLLPNNGSYQCFQNFRNNIETKTCECETIPVHPGDLNFDGIANYRDIIEFGFHVDKEGPARPEQGIEWNPYDSSDWGVTEINSYGNTFDIKHIDANGNGIIDIDDLCTLDTLDQCTNTNTNYNKTHNLAENDISDISTSGNPVLLSINSFAMTSQNNDTTIYEADVFLKDTTVNDVTVYGGYFSIKYDSIQQADSILLAIEVEFIEDSWLGEPGVDFQFIIEHDTIDKVFRIGFSRTDLSNATGSGLIARVIACTDNDSPGDITSSAKIVEPYFNLVKDEQEVVLPIIEIPELKAKVFLQAPLDTNTLLMNDDLRVQGLIPWSEPYSELDGFNHKLNEDTEVIGSDILEIEGNDAIVDWIFVELRDANNPSDVVGTRPALLQRDGDIVDIDGVSNLNLPNIDEGSYYIAIRHRNHLCVMSATAYDFSNTDITKIDFTNPATATYGTNAQANANGANAMWMGATNGSRIAYQGPDNTNNDIFFALLADPDNIHLRPDYTLTAYCREDINMDGKVIYQGVNNDPNSLFFTILNHPENTNDNLSFIIEQQQP